MATLDRVQSLKQFTKQKLAVVEDKSKIAMATVNRSGNKELDVAVVKATTAQFHVVPKEKHVRTLKNAVHPAKPRREVQYIITELLKRLHSAADWVTALKTLVTVHRLMRETDPSFIEELIKVGEDSSVGMRSPMTVAPPAADKSPHTPGGASKRSRGGAVLRVDEFIDKTNVEGKFECSEWVRAYGRYLDEQLEVYSSINFCLEVEDSSGEGRLRRLAPKDLLFQLPRLQRLLARLTDCVPRGSAVKDDIVQLSVTMVVKESFKLYKVIGEGVINLVDSFFEMDYLDAQRGLESYKQYLAFTDSLQTYYAQMDSMEEVKRHVQCPLDFKLETPPPGFVTQMEAYCRDAPRTVDESGAGGAAKVSPPLRRGRQGSNRVLRPTGVAVSHSSDPGMVLPPGVADKFKSEGSTKSLGSTADAAAAAAAAAAGVKQEVDLLSLDMEETLVVGDAHANGGPAAANGTSPLSDLFADSFTSQAGGPAPGASAFADMQQQQPAGQSFSSQPGNPFGGGAAAAPPAPLQTSGLGGGGYGGGGDAYGNNGGFAPPAAPSPHAFTPQQQQLPAGFSPMVQQQRGSFSSPPQPGVGGGFTPQPLPGGLSPTTSPHRGGPHGGGGGFSSPSGGSGGAASPMPPNTNIRNSALHDPFAEFNMLRKPEPTVAAAPSPSMRALRQSAEGSLGGLASGGSFGGGAPPASPGQPRPSGLPPASPNTSFSSAPGGYAAARVGGAGGGASFGNSGSFSSQQQQQHAFGQQASFGSQAGQGFGNSGSFGYLAPQQAGGSFGGGPPQAPTPTGAAAFPMQFSDNRGTGLL